MPSPEDFRLDLRFGAPAADLYAQFATEAGIRNWWTINCEMEERVGGRAAFRFPGSGFYAVVRIARLEPGRLVEWECLDNQHPENAGFADLKDWIGTRMRFEIEEADGGASRLVFTHAGLGALECHGVCSSAWSFFLNESLRRYLETGTGAPDTSAG